MHHISNILWRLMLYIAAFPSKSVRNSRLIAQKNSAWPLVCCHFAQPNLYLNAAIKLGENAVSSSPEG